MLPPIQQDEPDGSTYETLPPNLEEFEVDNSTTEMLQPIQQHEPDCSMDGTLPPYECVNPRDLHGPLDDQLGIQEGDNSSDDGCGPYTTELDGLLLSHRKSSTFPATSENHETPALERRLPSHRKLPPLPKLPATSQNLGTATPDRLLRSHRKSPSPSASSTTSESEEEGNSLVAVKSKRLASEETGVEPIEDARGEPTVDTQSQGQLPDSSDDDDAEPIINEGWERAKEVLVAVKSKRLASVDTGGEPIEDARGEPTVDTQSQGQLPDSSDDDDAEPIINEGGEPSKEVPGRELSPRQRDEVSSGSMKDGEGGLVEYVSEDQPFDSMLVDEEPLPMGVVSKNIGEILEDKESGAPNVSIEKNGALMDSGMTFTLAASFEPRRSSRIPTKNKPNLKVDSPRRMKTVRRRQAFKKDHIPHPASFSKSSHPAIDADKTLFSLTPRTEGRSSRMLGRLLFVYMFHFSVSTLIVFLYSTTQQSTLTSRDGDRQSRLAPNHTDTFRWKSSHLEKSRR